MKYHQTHLLPFAVLLLLQCAATSHAKVEELPAEQTRQSVDLDYKEEKEAVPGTPPECVGGALSKGVNCVTIFMDGPQGGSAGERRATLAGVPVTPVLKKDDQGDQDIVFVELEVETGNIGNIQQFSQSVQSSLRRDLFKAKQLLKSFSYTLTQQEIETLLEKQQPIEFEIKEGWDRLEKLRLVNAKIRVEPPGRKAFDFAGLLTDLRLIHSYYPKNPVDGAEFGMGFRVFNLTQLTAADATLEFSFLGIAKEEPLTELVAVMDFCAVSGDGRVICPLGDVWPASFRDIEIKGIVPSGGFVWQANLYSDGEKKDRIWYGQLEAPITPVISNIFVLDDQTAKVRPESSDFKHPYPSNAGPTGRTRWLFVLGENLPTKPTDDLKFESGSSDVSYRFLGFEDKTVHKHGYTKGWELARSWLKADQGVDLKGDYSGLLFQADLKGDVLPGEKTMKVSGAVASWDLRFGGLKAVIEFVRRAQTGREEVLDSAFTPERIRIRVRTTYPIPVSKVPVFLYEKDAKGRVAKTHRLTAESAGFNASGASFTTQPLRFVDKGRANLSPTPEFGDIPLTVRLAGVGPHQLGAEIDPTFVKTSFLMPVPKTAGIAISSSPGTLVTVKRPQPRDWLFRSATKKAMVCMCSGQSTSQGAPSKYCDAKTLRDWDAMTRQVADSIENTIVFTFMGQRRLEKKISIGHHAAALMSRDMIVEMLEDTKTNLATVRGSDLKLSSFREVMLPHLAERDFAINRIKVTLPDGTKGEYGGWPLLDGEALAKKFGKDQASMNRWRLSATSEAISGLIGHVDKAIARAKAVGDCDPEDLVKLTGLGFDSVRQRLRPRLMRLYEDDRDRTKRLYWVQDTAARYWMDDLAPLAAGIRKQELAARQDTKIGLFVLALATLPVAISGDVAAGLIALTLDAGVLGYTAYDEVTQVMASEAEIDFSQGAAVVIGTKRIDQALKEAKTRLGAAGSITLASIPILLQYKTLIAMKEQGLMALIRSDRAIARGMLVTQSLRDRGINSLSEIEKRHVAAFMLRSQMRQAADAAALSKLETRALDVVDQQMRALAATMEKTWKEATVSVGKLADLPTPIPKSAGKVDFVVDAGSATPAAKIEVKMRLEDIVDPAVPRGAANVPLEKLAQNYGYDLAELDDLGRLLLGRIKTTPRGKWGLLQGKTLTVAKEAGGVETIHLRNHLGSGTFSSAFRAAPGTVGKDDVVAKILWRHMSDEVDPRPALDHGYNLLESIKSPHFRVYKRQGDLIDIADRAEGHMWAFSRVEFVERVKATAQEQILEQGGKMTLPQEAAYLGMLRDLNRKGIAWLDPKWDNFAFVEIGNKTQIVIIDTGGIVRMAGPNAAGKAFEVQKLINGRLSTAARYLQKTNSAMFTLAKGDPDNVRHFAVSVWPDEDFADLTIMGLQSHRQIHCGPSAGRRFKALAEKFEAAPP